MGLPRAGGREERGRCDEICWSRYISLSVGNVLESRVKRGAVAQLFQRWQATGRIEKRLGREGKAGQKTGALGVTSWDLRAGSRRTAQAGTHKCSEV